MTGSGEVHAMTHRLLHHRAIQSFTFLVGIWSLALPAAARAADRPQRSQPLRAALDLLRWRPEDTPAIVVVDVRPDDVSVTAEGWVARHPDGVAPPTIYIAGWSELYRKSSANPQDVHLTIRLAGVLTHERVHLCHGPDEAAAYAAQLIVLDALHAPPLDITNVRRALERVKRQHREH
jgi:hypothetical protein